MAMSKINFRYIISFCLQYKPLNKLQTTHIYRQCIICLVLSKIIKQITYISIPKYTRFQGLPNS